MRRIEPLFIHQHSDCAARLGNLFFYIKLIPTMYCSQNILTKHSLILNSTYSPILSVSYSLHLPFSLFHFPFHLPFSHSPVLIFPFSRLLSPFSYHAPCSMLHAPCPMLQLVLLFPSFPALPPSPPLSYASGFRPGQRQWMPCFQILHQLPPSIQVRISDRLLHRF